ncbi:hypothetical protein [Flaviaesturariibacter amylovorans]|uniref:DUF2306 domain-containing protein n=1 Tax=Flaviaesturariibacter amylovorans TaxID=1084520 RepID=A0ABP8HR40_9BACT
MEATKTAPPAAPPPAPAAARVNAMDRYKTLHLWMLLPMLVMQAGIFKDYWGDFTDNAWSVHVHYWTGTAWYAFLISQPYLASHGQLAKHRTYGIIGMFLAGSVCMTALSMMHRDIATAERSAVARDAFGPFEPWFFYGVAAIEIVMMTAFGIAVIMSILHRKRWESHAWWLISSVFIIMMPALGRGLQGLYVGLNRQDWPNVDIMPGVYAANVIIIGGMLLAAWKWRRMWHPATWLAVGVNLFNFVLEPIGRSAGVQSFLRALIHG